MALTTENKKILRTAAPHIWEALKRIESTLESEPVSIVESKSGLPTLKVEQEGREVFIHSKYEPIHEAQRWVEQFNPSELARYKHILFYGVGMGYHIEAFLEKFPDKLFSLYEPVPTCFYHYANTMDLRRLPLDRLKKIQIENTLEDRETFFNLFLSDIMNGDVLFVSLPSYERTFKEKFQGFSQRFTEIVTHKRFNMGVNYSFEKLWTTNSLMNLTTTLNTPNILHCDKEMFKEKPAMIVSAGPSLEDEIENLRYIKKNGLAYIFSVGSSINTLLEYGIEPDAVCNYDPQDHNYNVYTKLRVSGIDSIPLIYGTSVGYETVSLYRGPKLHAITSQDTVSPYYLKRKDGQPLDIIQDAPSVAIVTLQLLMKLGCNPIYLVGQNLAYRGDRYYASGIPYYSQTTNEQLLKDAVQVEDVYGNQTYTNEGFDKMRVELERYILANPQYKVLNTTKGGAKIEGAPFVLLEEELKNTLRKGIVTKEWYKQIQNQGYDSEYAVKKSHTIIYEVGVFKKQVKELEALFSDIKDTIKKRRMEKLAGVFNKFDKLFKKIIRTRVYQVYLIHMNRVKHELLLQQVAELRSENDLEKKARSVMHLFGTFLGNCMLDLEKIKFRLEEVKEILPTGEIIRGALDELKTKVITINGPLDCIDSSQSSIPNLIKFKIKKSTSPRENEILFDNVDEVISNCTGIRIGIYPETKSIGIAVYKSGEITSLEEDINICDGLWHSIEISRKVVQDREIVQLSIDHLSFEKSIEGPIDDHAEVSRNLIIGKNRVGNRNVFIGQLKEIEIN